MDLDMQFVSPKVKVDLTPLNQIIPTIKMPELRLNGTTATRIAQTIGIKDPTVLAHLQMAFNNPAKYEAFVNKQLALKLQPYQKKAEVIQKLIDNPLALEHALAYYITGFAKTLLPSKEGKYIKQGLQQIQRSDTMLGQTKDAMLLALAAATTAKQNGRDPLFAAASVLNLISGESAGSPTARNKDTQAYGLLQILPMTWSHVASSNVYNNTIHYLNESGFSRLMANILNVPLHYVSDPARELANVKHYSEQYPIAVAHYNTVVNRVLGTFEFKRGAWCPRPGLVNPNKWKTYLKISKYNNTYTMGLQSLITAMHINGVNAFQNSSPFRHSERINTDAAVLGYMTINPVFRSKYNELLNALKNGSLLPSLFGDPFLGLSLVSGYNKKRTLKIKGITKTDIHHGVDIQASGGTVLYAPFSGFVTLSRYSESAGNMLKLTSAENGDSILLFHLKKKGHALGPVEEGSIIGIVGSTGLSEAPHIHLEYFTKSGKRVDPVNAPYQFIKLIKKQEVLV
jgi:hypothetical protein